MKTLLWGRVVVKDTPTFVERREAIECSVVLLKGLAEVVGGETVLAQRAVNTAKVVEEVGAETFARVGTNRILGGGA